VSSLAAFSIEDVARLTGLSVRQLGYFDRTGFFSPSFAAENRREPYSRIYSFRDVVGLRTIAEMRNALGISMQELRKIKPWLEQRHESPWASLRFYVGGRHVFFDDPATGARMAGRPAGQFAMPIEMKRIADEMEKAAQGLKERQPDQFGQVVRHRYVQNNAWVVDGTRIPTAAIWRLHDAGYTVQAIIDQYPSLTPADVEAAIAHEAKLRTRKKAG
jgi:DNA-binding transcriptional MerR regulator